MPKIGNCAQSVWLHVLPWLWLWLCAILLLLLLLLLFSLLSWDPFPVDSSLYADIRFALDYKHAFGHQIGNAGSSSEWKARLRDGNHMWMFVYVSHRIDNVWLLELSFRCGPMCFDSIFAQPNSIQLCTLHTIHDMPHTILTYS